VSLYLDSITAKVDQSFSYDYLPGLLNCYSRLYFFVVKQFILAANNYFDEGSNGFSLYSNKLELRVISLGAVISLPKIFISLQLQEQFIFYDHRE
jgi:hypothetical protein